MVFHLGGFLEDIDPAGAFANITALADDRLFTQGDDIRVPPLNNVIVIAAGLDNVVDPRARLESPTLDELVRYETSPVNVGTTDVEPGTPQAVDDMRQNPLVLGVDEILQCQILSNPAAAGDQWVLLWFADGPPQPVTGNRIFTVRYTGATTVTARAWTPVNITLDENLPPGDYAVVGLRPSGASCLAARLVFRTGDFWRPGALGVDAAGDIQHPMFRKGQLGIWGEFPFTQIPAIEYLCDLADTAQTGHLDLIRLR